MNQLLLMKGWKSYVLWEGFPFLVLLATFGVLSAINWNYEKKLLTPMSGVSDRDIAYMGPELLVFAVADALFASVIHFIVRITGPKNGSRWYLLIVLTVTAIFLIFPSLFIIVLGPAGISTYERLSMPPR